MKQRCYELLNTARAGDTASSFVDGTILLLIIISIFENILASVPSIKGVNPEAFLYVDAGLTLLFTIEYCLRVWSCTEAEPFKGPLRGRIRYIFTPLALIDLLAILPSIIPLLVFDLKFMRVFRLFRVFRVLRAARYTRALTDVLTVIGSCMDELIATFSISAIMLIVSASLMYYAESAVQPETFGSIPLALWWAVVTLTTVGYGDAYPVTLGGKIIAALFALLGIALVGLPTGIIASEFTTFLQQKKKKSTDSTCPYCGQDPAEAEPIQKSV